jgi:LCP family protein required for cell wall assembly
MGTSYTKRRLVVLFAVIGLLLAGMGLAFAYSTWGKVNRVSIDRPGGQSPGPVAHEAEEGEEDVDVATDLGDETEIVLLVGSDDREVLDDLAGFGDFEGRRADVVMVMVKAPTATALLSLPRDLLVHDACTDEENRLNALLEGCRGRMNGPTLLLLGVEELIGQPVDHYAMVDLAGFQEVVDEIGGYRICVNNPVRDPLAALSLPDGCTDATGAQTLAWLRSRHTEELTGDGWGVMPGMNDLARNQRQREFLIDMMGRLADFSSPGSLAALAGALAPHITVDDELTLSDAVDLAWAMRSLGRGAIDELEVPVADHITDTGAAVLVPTRPVADIVDEFLETGATADGSGVVAG